MASCAGEGSRIQMQGSPPAIGFSEAADWKELISQAKRLFDDRDPQSLNGEDVQ
jgi:hypothetical protein